MTVKIVTDSASDLPADLGHSLGISVVPLNVNFGSDSFKDGVTISSDEFYDRLARGPVLPTTSQPSPGDFVEVYDRRPSPILRRIIISAMGNWGCHYWLSDLKNRYGSLDEWEKRAVIVASYFLTDEGKHWRDHTKRTWNKTETMIRDWFCNRFQTQKNVPP